MDRDVVLEEEGFLAWRIVVRAAVFEFEDGLGEAAKLERFDEVVDDIELVAFGTEVGVGADDDDRGATREGFEEGDAINAGELEV